MSTEEPVLSVTGLAKRFQRGREVIHVLGNLDWQLKRDCSVAIMGSSGSGKSTLLSLIAGFDMPSAGTVVWTGLGNVSALPEQARKRFYQEHVGFIFQKLNLLSDLTAFQNILLALTLAGMSIPDAERAAIRSAESLGIAELLDSRISDMSQGQAQRVAIARALAKRPRILLADEPTGSVDANNAASVLDLMLRARTAMHGTLVLVTHDAAVAGRCDSVLCLEGGQLHPRTS